MLISLSIFLVTGAVAGLLAGLLGIGGGMVIVPALVFTLPALGVAPDVLTQVAVGTSLACISAISISSARAHHVRGGVIWGVFAAMAPGLGVGALAGAALAHVMPSLWLQRVVGVAALLVAVKLLADIAPAPHRDLPGRPALTAAGGIIGSLSSLIGIGGGSLTVPYLVWCNVPITRAVGTSAACGMPIAWAGAVGFAVAGWGLAGIGPGSLGYLNLPATGGIVAGSLLFTPLGAALAHRLPARALKRVFALLLVVVGVRMLWG